MIKLCAFADEYGSSLKEQIECLKENGISLLEVRSINGKNVADFTDAEAINYYQSLKNSGIDVWSIGSPLGKVDIDCNFAEYEVKIRRVCRTANLMHTDKIRIFSFYKAYESKAKVIDYLSKMVDIAKEYDVQLYHENEKDIYGDEFCRVKELMSNVKGLNFIFDPANYVQCGENCKKVLESSFKKFGYFHIKDVVKKTGELVPAGEGDGAIPYMIEKIGKLDRVLTLEPHLALFDAYKDIDNTEMKHKFEFKNGKEAFNFAVKTLKDLTIKKGYKEQDGGFVK